MIKNSDSWLFFFAACEGTAGFLFILEYFGVTSLLRSVMPSNYLLILAVVLFAASFSFSMYGLYRVNRPRKELATSLTTQTKRPLIKITEPPDNSTVKFEAPVAGFIDPPAEWVQLLVGANDGLWHVQPKDAYVNARAWNGKCQFGNSPKDSAGKSYTIVAVTGEKKLPKGAKLPEIPANLTQSNWVTVRRDS